MKMYIWLNALILGLLLLITGCVSYNREPEEWRAKISYLVAGLSTQEILDRLGEADKVGYDKEKKDCEYWVYSCSKDTKGRDAFLLFLAGGANALKDEQQAQRWGAPDSSKEALGAFLLTFEKNKLIETLFVYSNGRKENIPLLLPVSESIATPIITQVKSSKVIDPESSLTTEQIISQTFESLLHHNSDSRYPADAYSDLILSWYCGATQTKDIYFINATVRSNKYHLDIRWMFVFNASTNVITYLKNDSVQAINEAFRKYQYPNH